MIYLIIVFAFLLVAFGVYQHYEKKNKPIVLHDPQPAEGEVVDVTEVRGTAVMFSDGKVAYYPVIRFLVPGGGGKAVRFQGRVGASDAERVAIGKKIKVAYEKSNPLRAKIDQPLE